MCQTFPQTSRPRPSTSFAHSGNSRRSKERPSCFTITPGYSTKETAAIIGSTAGAVGIHLDRGRGNCESSWEMTMPELDERLHGIDRLEPPNLWDAARARAASPHPPAPGPSGGKKILIIAVAFVVSAVALAFVVTAFRSGDPERPVEPPRNVMNGDLWVKVGGGEIGTAIGRVNLDSSVGGGFMWTDAPNVFADTPAASELLADDYAFSPDGSRVVFSHATAPAPGSGPPNQPVELFVMDADGSGLRQLTHDDAYAAFPAWFRRTVRRSPMRVTAVRATSPAASDFRSAPRTSI